MLKEYQLLTVIVNFKCYPNSEMFVNQKAFIFSTECMSIRGGTNSSMFANCLVIDDVQKVRSLVFGQIQMFGCVRSSGLKILKNALRKNLQ